MDRRLLSNMDRSRHMYSGYEDYSSANCTVTLKNLDLWKKFNDLETEMIITKSGRRMFPSLHIEITDLDPHAHYCILLEMAPATHTRYKYSSSGGWVPAGIEEAQSPQRIYLHPESPATGEYWMSQPISFGRLKLTNTPAPPIGHVVLSSMHKYQPRIIISKTSDPRNVAWAPSSSVEFSETQFIAVTAYQNERITKLKIDNNPFAKGFRENGQSKCKRKRVQTDEKVEEEKPGKELKVEAPASPKIEDDRVSSCSSASSTSSPKVYRVHLSPASNSGSSHYPISYSYKLPLPASTMNFYPYYYSPQYPMYTPTVWGGAPPFYYQHTLPSAGLVEDLTVQAPAEKKPRKLTDFSIRAITGCS